MLLTDEAVRDFLVATRRTCERLFERRVNDHHTELDSGKVTTPRGVECRSRKQDIVDGDIIARIIELPRKDAAGPHAEVELFALEVS